MKSKYAILVRILDDICRSAPNRLTIYKPSPKNRDGIVAARSRALLHLYLMVKCGCDEDNFKAREELICDGSNDGGLDAYFIDTERKRILLIQSKFRANADNFEDISIKADDLIKTEFDRITQGYSTDSKGKRFNAQVLKFQRKLTRIGGIAQFEYMVILLGNLTQYSSSQINRLVGNHPYEIINADAIYDRLVFPVCQGTYFNPREISLKVPLSKSEPPRLKQSIRTRSGQCEITVIYVPVIEIGKMLQKYKNAILEFNPRNYLSLSSAKSVNAQIASSITGLPTNDFAILNNGITILADDCSVTIHSGKKNVGVLTLVDPQIINGGQTAYTLSELYAENGNSTKMFQGKEVMLKIVQLLSTKGNKNEFVAMISNATNQQNPVKEADRRSNNPVLTELQQRVFGEYGFFFERKRGEFFNGGKRGYMAGQHIINRAELIRAWYSFSGKPTSARKGETALFDENELRKILPNLDKFRHVFFSYVLLLALKKKQKEYSRGQFDCAGCDNAFRYGKYAVIAAVGCQPPDIKPKMGISDIEKVAINSIVKVLKKWRDFEKFAKSQAANSAYFGRGVDNFDNYYKGKTIDSDVHKFFAVSKGG